MNWRLITYGEFDPAFNMAADEAILEAHLAGEVPPTLRLYGWNPAAISIGYSQKISEAEIQSITDHGLDVVRRTTGGRAVLHAGDLTYSFVGSSIGDDSHEQQHFLSTSVAAAYKEICQGLILAFEEFGITLELGSSKSDYRTNYDCFRATTNADLQYAGKKMIGSAQLRRKNAVLQHGSILLDQDQNKMTEVYGGTKSEATEDRHANLFEILKKTVSMSELEAALKAGFGKAFAVEFDYSPLTQLEQNRIEALTPKYRVLT
ncbi:MAG: lipoate--protein ligase family protein [Cyanobacteria bacterium SZAS-4]|nr:lipoate--protein ligase family protein [Cyanobacteria bacterium SZAS-4]